MNTNGMTGMTVLSDLKFLIIAGTSKGGTTSVFNYLARHPEICPSDKETRFFLDLEYPLPSKKRYERDGIEAYLPLFDSGPKQNWRFEASPDYLYSSSTSRLISQTLPNVRILFILRDPISRLLSWYRFGRAMSEIPLTISFDEYVNVQRENENNGSLKAPHPAFFALQQGRYSQYLKSYIEVFDNREMGITFSEHLWRDPASFMMSLCQWVGIDQSYFRGQRFEIINKFRDVRSRGFHKLYSRSKVAARHLLGHTPKLRQMFRQIRPRFDATYEKINVTKGDKIAMSPATRNFILSYYADEARCLKEMFDLEAPWPSGRLPALAEVRSE